MVLLHSPSRVIHMNQRSGKRLFLTGATGFLGAYLILYLLKQSDVEIICLARGKSGMSGTERVQLRLCRLLSGRLAGDNRFNVDIDQVRARVTVVEGELQKPRLGLAPDTWRTLHADAIWHCAADVDFAESRSRQVMETNYGGTCNILEFARDKHVPELNYVSTAYVCGDRLGRIAESPADWSVPVNNPYERSKRLCEQAVYDAHRESGLRYRVFRPAIIVGHSRTLEVDSSSGLYTYLAVMLRLKNTVQLRMPEYFTHHSLKLACDDVSVNLVCVDQVVEAMARIAACGIESANRIYQLVNPDPPLTTTYMRALSDIFGIVVERAGDTAALNPVDSLMNNQTGIYSAYLRKDKVFLDDNTMHFSGLPPAHFHIDEAIVRRLTQGIYDHFNEDQRTQRNRLRSTTQVLARRMAGRDGMEALPYYAGGADAGPTLVILNAYGQSLAFWDRLVGELITDYRVLIWQMRGTASQKGGMDQAYPIAEHVRDMEAIFDAEHIAQAHLLGWCTGPKLALEFYAAQAQRVASMIFLTGCFIHDPVRKPLYTEYENYMNSLCRMVDQRPQIAAQLTEILSSVLLGKRKPDPHKAVDSSHHEPLVEGVLALIGEDIKPLVLEPFLTQQSIVSYARQLLAFWDHDVGPILGSVRMPTLFIGGEVDNIASAQMARAVAQRVPRAIYAQVQGGTHYMHFDSHHLLSDLIRDFLEQGFACAFPHGLVTLEYSDAEPSDPPNPQTDLPTLEARNVIRPATV